MSLYQILTIGGAPAICAAGLTYIVKSIKRQRDTQEAVNTALKLGMQAVLRDRLLSTYKEYVKAGYIEYDDRLNWDNLYENYHVLGANGIMDSYRERLMALPTQGGN